MDEITVADTKMSLSASVASASLTLPTSGQLPDALSAMLRPLKPVRTVVPPQGMPSHMMSPTFGALPPLPPCASTPPVKAPPLRKAGVWFQATTSKSAVFLQLYGGACHDATLTK